MKNLTLTYLFLLLLFSCSGGGEDAGCSEAGNCERTTAERPRTESLRIDMEDSMFWDINSRSLYTIENARIGTGDIGIIPVYSHLINKPLAEVEPKILTAARDAAMGNIDEEGFNNIPFFRIRKIPTYTYLFNYTRRLGNTIVAGASGNIDVEDSTYVYLPMINEVFNGQLSSLLVGGASSSDYIHTISITATSPNAKDAEIKTFRFRILLNFPTKAFVTEISDEMKEFNLQNRWRFYYSTEGTPNDDLLIARIVDGQETPDSQSADLRVVFREPPVLRVIQNLFEEETIDLQTLKETGAILPSRGNRFIHRSIPLTSASHFKLKISVNGQYVTLDGNNEVIVRNIPADTRWDFSFHADFNRNAAYPASRNLLSPLRPMCSLIHSPSFLPVTAMDNRDAAESTGGYYSVCHPDTAKFELVPPELINAPPVSLRDTWFDFFSYRRSSINFDNASLYVHDVGHFYGLSEIRFAISGCLRVYSREASSLSVNPNAWELKSEAHEECGESDGLGWVFYNIEYQTSISEFRDSYDGNLDLQILIDSLLNRTPSSRADFRMNNHSGAELDRFY